jgi:transketolase
MDQTALPFLTDQEREKLAEIATTIREDIIKMLIEAGSGHSAGPLGLADILTSLYFNVIKHKPDDPNWKDRDRLILSCGHYCPVLYAVLARSGYFPVDELKTLRKLGSRLQGHPHRTALPGLETTSGPLGSGLSQAAGMALAFKMDGSKQRVYCITSDGEHDAGNTWEGAMFAGKNKLNNLTVILDRNNIQIDGFTENIMPLEPIRQKYESFGFHVIEIDGHNYDQIVSACRESWTVFEKPTLILAHTIPGKGVDFMENNFFWHGSPPDLSDVKGAPPKGHQAEEALKQLRTLMGRIKSEHE